MVNKIISPYFNYPGKSQTSDDVCRFCILYLPAVPAVIQYFCLLHRPFLINEPLPGINLATNPTWDARVALPSLKPVIVSGHPFIYSIPKVRFRFNGNKE